MRYIFLALFLITSAIYGQQIIKDLTVQDLKVVSTTKGSKPCPLMTQTQINAIGSPLNGQCVYNTTTNKLNVYNGSLWKAAGGGVDSWATATVYAVNDLVIESNKIYKCLIAHTSGTFATDLAASRWIEVSAGVSSHLDLTDIGTNTHAQIDSHIASTSNPHSVTAAQVGLGAVVNADTTTTANITDSLNKRFVTDAEKTVIGNTSGTNTGDQDLSGLVTLSTNQTITGLKQFSSSIGIGGAANANAVLDVQSTTKAFLPPRMTTAQMNAIASPVAGMTVYNTDFKATASYDGTKWVYGFGFLNLDNTFSATSSTTSGAVTLENVDFINGNCTASNPTTCTFKSGTFTQTPNCSLTSLNGGNTIAYIDTVSSTSISVYTYNTAGASLLAGPFTLACRKVGADYLSASSNAYASTNANYDWTSYTPTTQGLGTPSATSCFHKRDGGDLYVDCKITVGTTTAVEARIGLPNSLEINPAYVPNLRVAGGTIASDQPSNPAIYMLPLMDASATYLNIGGKQTSQSSLIKANGNDYINTGNTISIKAGPIPISGWSNAPFIVGSFQGYNSTPGMNNPKFYSATVSATGVVSNEKGDLINGNCTNATTSVCTFNSVFTSTPNCEVSAIDGGNYAAYHNGTISSTSISVTRNNTTNGTASSIAFSIFCHGE